MVVALRVTNLSSHINSWNSVFIAYKSKHIVWLIKIASKKFIKILFIIINLYTKKIYDKHVYFF